MKLFLRNNNVEMNANEINLTTQILQLVQQNTSVKECIKIYNDIFELKREGCLTGRKKLYNGMIV